MYEQSESSTRPVGDCGRLSSQPNQCRRAGPNDTTRAILGKVTQTLSASAAAGATLAQVPAHTFSLWNRYDVTQRWGVGAGVIHSSQMFTPTDNIVILPSFMRVDAAVFTASRPPVAGYEILMCERDGCGHRAATVHVAVKLCDRQAAT